MKSKKAKTSAIEMSNGTSSISFSGNAAATFIKNLQSAWGNGEDLIIDVLFGEDAGGGGGSLESTTFSDNKITPAMVAGYLAYKNQGTGYNYNAWKTANGKGFGYSFTTDPKEENANTLRFGYISMSSAEKALGGIGDGSSLYTTDAGLPVHTVEEWVAHYDGNTFNQIATEQDDEHLLGITTKGGPDLNWRFVILRDFKVLDMRHVLVVGMKTKMGFKVGVSTGIAIEVLQNFNSASETSANKKQDYLSNAIGSAFLTYLRGNSCYYDPRHSTTAFGNATETSFAGYFLNFINQR